MNKNALSLVSLTVVVYALGYPLGALTLRGVSPFWLIALRFLLTAALLWPVIAARRIAVPRGRALGHAVGAGLLVQGAQFLGAYWALSHGVGAGVTALVVAMNPALTAVLGAGLRRARRLLRLPDAAGSGARVPLAAVGLATAAVLVACAPKIVADPSVGPAVAAAVLALVGLTAGSLWQGAALRDVAPLSFTAIGVSASAPVALLPALSTPGRLPGTPADWTLLVLLTLCGLAGTTLYAVCVRRLGAGQASVLFALIPAVAALLSWPILGEVPGALTLAGLLLGAAAVAAQLLAGRAKGGPHATRGVRGRGARRVTREAPVEPGTSSPQGVAWEARP